MFYRLNITTPQGISEAMKKQNKTKDDLKYGSLEKHSKIAEMKTNEGCLGKIKDNENF